MDEGTIIGSGISSKLTGIQERKVNEKVIFDYKPRGTHTLGPLFGSKHGEKKMSGDK